MDFRKAIAATREILPLEEIEKEVFRHALKLTRFNVSLAASQLKVGRTTLYRKMKKYGIKKRR